jgi:hypothetical protein
VRVTIASLPPGYHVVRGHSGEDYGIFTSGDTIEVSEFDWLQQPNRFVRRS